MKIFTFCSWMFLSLLLGISFAQAPTYSRYTKGGGTAKDNPHALSVDPAGNVYMTGEFTNTAAFPPVSLTSAGNVDFCLIKYDSLFNAIWGIKAGSTLTDRGYGVALDSDGNVYATGEYYGTVTFGTSTFTSAGNLDAFLMKLDSAGNYLWVKDIKGVAQLAMRGMVIDKDDNVIILGYFGSSTTGQTTATLDSIVITTNGARDILLAKYTKDGTILWARNFGGINSGEEGRAVTVDTEGNIYITGVITGTSSIGSFILNGYNTTQTDMFVAKVSPDGNVLWANMAGGIKGDEGSGITLDKSGNVFVGGRVDSAFTFDNNPFQLTKGAYDAYIAKYDVNGNYQWVKTLGGTGNDFCYDLLTDKDGNILAFGNYLNTAYYNTDSLVSAGAEDIYILSLTASGETNYWKRNGGSGADKGLAMGIDLGGNIYLTGSFAATLKLDGDSLISAGGEDIFIAKMGNNPVPVELVSFSASVNGKNVILSWETATEINNSGFTIERSTDKVNFSAVAFVKGNGTTTERSSYKFTDSKLQSLVYYYRLKQVDLDGKYEYSKIVEVNLEVPSSFSLSQNYPNPFNPTTEISFSIPVDADVTITLYNTVGEKVQELSRNYSAGTYTYTFNGSSLSSGVYYYSVNAISNSGSLFNASRKMVLLK